MIHEFQPSIETQREQRQDDLMNPRNKRNNRQKNEGQIIHRGI